MIKQDKVTFHGQMKRVIINNGVRIESTVPIRFASTEDNKYVMLNKLKEHWNKNNKFIENNYWYTNIFGKVDSNE